MLRRSEFRNGAPSVAAPDKKRMTGEEKRRARHRRFYEYRRQRQEEARIEGRSEGEETPAAEETPNEVTSEDESSTIAQPGATPPPPPPPAQTSSSIESTTTSAIPPPPPPQETTTDVAAIPIVQPTTTSTPQAITTPPPQTTTSTPRTFSTTFTPKDHSSAPLPTALPIVEETRGPPSSTPTSTPTPSPSTSSQKSESPEPTSEATSKSTLEATSKTEQPRPALTTPTVKEEASTSVSSKVTATSSIFSTATAVAGGLGGPSQTGKSSGLSGVAMALIILGVLLSAILMIGLAYAFVQRSIIFARLKDRRSKSQPQDPGWPQPQPPFQQRQPSPQLQTSFQTPLPPPPTPPVQNPRATLLGIPISMPFRSQEPNTPMTESRDNRIWGGASTADTETLVEYPAYVPPLMQKGGVYDPNEMEDARSEVRPHPALIDPALFAPPPAPPRQSVLRHQSRYTESSRDSVMTSTTSTTLSSIPRFRTIKSWTQDQRRRIYDPEAVPAMPRNTYERL